MKRLRTTVFGLGMAGLVFGGGAYGVNWWELRQLVITTDNAYVRGNVAEIASMVDGYIEDIHVTSHQTVAPGDALLTIRGERYEAAVDAARAELRAAEADIEIGLAAIENEKARRRLQHSLIDQAAARVEAEKAEADQAAREVARYSELLERQTGSRQKYEAVATAHRTSVADVARAEAELVAARDRIPVFDSEIRRLEREIERLRALAAQAASRLDSAEIALSDTLVTAPVAGVIGNLRVEPGMYTKAGWPMMAVVPLYDTYIVANFKETQLARLRIGQEVRIEVDAFPGVPLIGRLDSLAPASAAEFSLLPPQNATGNFVKVVQRVPVKITYEVPEALAGRVVPGMSVVVTVDTRDAPDGAVIADNAPRPAPGSG